MNLADRTESLSENLFATAIRTTSQAKPVLSETRSKFFMY